MNNKVVPDYIPRRISKIKCRKAINVECAFVKDEIVFYSEYITSLKTCLQTFWKKAWTSISFFDIFRFSKYLSILATTLKIRLDNNKSFLHFLIKRMFCYVLTSDKHIFNFSSYVLLDCEKLVLSRVLNFCNIDSVMIFSEFELLFLQLLKLCPVSQQNLSSLKTSLADLANGRINTTVNSCGFLW